MKIFTILFSLLSLYVYPQVQKTTSESEISSSVVESKKNIRENTIAILPVFFMDTDSEINSLELGELAQQEIQVQLNDAFEKKHKNLAILDDRETLSLLKEAGIDGSNIDETPIEKLQNILGVDHLFIVKIYYSKKRTYVSVKKDNMDSREKSYESGYEESFFYTVYMNVYKNNSCIFKKSKSPAFAIENSWILSTNYLINKLLSKNL